MELESQLQTQLFELHSLQVRLEALLEAAQQQHSAPQLSVHVLESRHSASRGRLSVRLLSEGRTLMTREVQLERNTTVSWLETFSFPIQALDGELRVQMLDNGQLQSTGGLRLNQLLDQERHDIWLPLGQTEVRLAPRLIHSPEICFKHALQLVQTKAARTEVLLLSCSLDRPHQQKDLSVHCILSFKVAHARRQLKYQNLLKSLVKRMVLQLIAKAKAVAQRTNATVIARAYRRYRQQLLRQSKAIYRESDAENLSVECASPENSGYEPQLELSEAQEAEESSEKPDGSSDSAASSDSEVNYYDPATRQNRFGRR